MFFTKTQRCQFPVAKEDLKNRLIGKHVRIHNMDFEVYEKDHSLSIIPHAEQETNIKTLPITRVVMTEEGSKTNVVVTSRMRKLDSGGPILLVIFCIFLLIASVVFYFVRERTISITLLSIDAAIFILFFVRMQMGYFDYVRKIHAYVKSKGNLAANMDMNAPFAQA